KFFVEIFVHHFGRSQIRKTIFAVFIRKKKRNRKTSIEIWQRNQHILAARPYMQCVFVSSVSAVFRSGNFQFFIAVAEPLLRKTEKEFMVVEQTFPNCRACAVRSENHIGGKNDFFF